MTSVRPQPTRPPTTNTIGQRAPQTRPTTTTLPTTQYGYIDLRPQRTAVVFLLYADSPEPPERPAFATDEFMNLLMDDERSIDSYYSLMSHGQVHLVGADGPRPDVYGWRRTEVVRDTPEHCDMDTWPAAADRYATDLDRARYDKVIIVVPTNTCVEWAGYAGYGEQDVVVSVDPGTFDVARHTTLHELGHSFGLMHVGWVCHGPDGTRVAVSVDCETAPWDPFDPMGGAYRYVSAWSRHVMGMLDERDVTVVTHTGDYRLRASMSDAVDASELLLVPRGTVDDVLPDYYTIELRQPFGVWDDFAPTDPAANGLTIATFPGYMGDYGAALIDMTPGSQPDAPDDFGDQADWADGTLAVGASLTDPTSEITVALLDLTDGVATVRIKVTESDD